MKKKFMKVFDLDDNVMTALGIVFFVAAFIAILIFTFIVLNPYKEPINADRVGPKYKFACVNEETGEIVEDENCYSTVIDTKK